MDICKLIEYNFLIHSILNVLKTSIIFEYMEKMGKKKFKNS